MLKKIFNAVGKIFIFGLLGLLVLSFSIWGVGDVFRGTVDDAVATVGDAKITRGEFGALMSEEKEKLQQYFGGQVPEPMLKAMKIQERVLARLIEERLLIQAATSLGVVVGQEPVLREVGKIPQFRNADGTFSVEMFREMLRNQGQSEASFIARAEQALATQMLLDGLTAQPIISDAVLDAVYAFDHEQRVADVWMVPSDYISDIGDASESELATFYEGAKEQFASPELRSGHYVVIDQTAVTSDAAVSDDELKRAYEEHIGEFTKPETRTILLATFEDEAGVKEAAERVAKGEDFRAVAKKLTGASEADLKIDDVTQQDVLPELAAQIFSLKEGATSVPVQTDLGWHLARVVAITPGRVESFDQVKEKLSAAVRQGKSEELLYQLGTHIEDALAGGATLAEAAEKLNLDVKKFPEVTKEGKDSGGKPVKELPAFDNFLATVFATDKGQSSALTLSGDHRAYFILAVDHVAAARIKALDEIHGKVGVAWKEKRMGEVRAAVAQYLADKARNAPKLSAKELAVMAVQTPLLKEVKAVIKSGVKTFDTRPFGRHDKAEAGGHALPVTLIEGVFSVAGESSVTAHYPGSGGEYFVARVSKVIPAPAAGNSGYDAARAETRQRLAYGFNQDVWEQYIHYLRRKFPVEIYDDKINAAE